VRDGIVTVRYFTAADLPMVRELLDELEASQGATAAELARRWQETDPSERSAQRALVKEVLRREFGSKVVAAVSPRAARAAAFFAAADRRSRADALQSAAAELGVTPMELEQALLADLPGERRIAAPARPLGPDAVALRCNLLLQQSMLRRSIAVNLHVEGNARAIVRQAKLRGLICTVERARHDESAVLRVSGPMSLFRRTTMYGRHLAELVPLLGWCRRFRLEAACVIHGSAAKWVLRTGDPLCPSREPRRYDSRLEEGFARDFRRAAPAWKIVREPQAVPVGETLVFPDFAIQHREVPHRRWLIEIVGFWTEGYLEQKLDRLQRAGLDHLILCVDAARACSDGMRASWCRVVWFRKRIDPTEVLRIVQEE
jgi:predicted nuclease of restriction endonuclease-like RecB superfamily